MRVFFVIAMVFIGPLMNAQNYPCAKTGSSFMEGLISSWTVEAKDRTSPGQYEENKGISTIRWGVEGCSLEEDYAGTFKDHGYAVQYATYLTDSLTLVRTFYDSEHGGLMRFDGAISGDTLKAMWYRDDSKRMQVRNLLIRKSDRHFENITHLSTDHGQSWQLTHHWVYTKKD